ncbi:MAG: excalibur calcium-binding domain-containing protein [Burkholderiales bacterium]|nr:excalibur calcium-binding domain-containing protein [Burkholderiales bacterium]
MSSGGVKPEVQRRHAAPGVGGTSNDSRESFRCDGRKYCSQMNSCAEAKYFLANCPGVKMDGDRDGIPCEDQWCHP